MHVFLFVLLMDLVFGGLSFFYSNYAPRELGSRESTIGLIQVAGSASYILACTVLIHLASRRHALRVLIVAAACITATLAVHLVWLSVASFFLLGSLLGVLASLFFIHFQMLVRDESDGTDLRRKVGYYNVAWGIGYALGPGLAGLLYDQHAFAPLVMITGAAGVVAVASVFYRTSEPGLSRTARPPGAPSVRPIDHRYVVLGWMGGVVAVLTIAALRTMLPPAGAQLGWQSRQTGAVLFTAIIVQALTSGVLIFFRDYVYRVQWKMAFHVLGLAGWLTFALSTQFDILLAAAVAVGIWSGSCLYATFFYSMSHPQTTRTVSTNEMIVGIGLAVGPGLGGVLAEIDLHGPYWFNVGLVAVLMVAQLAVRGTWLRRNGSPGAHTPPA